MEKQININVIWIGRDGQNNKIFDEIKDHFKLFIQEDGDTYLLTSDKYNLNFVVEKDEITDDSIEFLKEAYMNEFVYYLNDIAEIKMAHNNFADKKALILIKKMVSHSKQYNKSKSQYEQFKNIILSHKAA